MKEKFLLGQVVMTIGVCNTLTEKEIMELIKRHVSGDWGDLPDEDKKLNDEALEGGNERLFSSYNTNHGKIWIISEYDHSVTTVLLPEEY